jgi:hypothetical protein
LLLKVEQSFCVIAKVTITSINAHRGRITPTSSLFIEVCCRSPRGCTGKRRLFTRCSLCPTRKILSSPATPLHPAENHQDGERNLSPGVTQEIMISIS